MPKVASFTLEFQAVENLKDGSEVYLQWSRRERTRTVVVANNVADFTGEAAHREAEAKSGGLRAWFHRHSSVVHLPEPLQIKLRQKGTAGWFSRGDRTLGDIWIDFSRHTNDKKRPLVLTFSNEGTAIVAPVLRVTVSCSWTETPAAEASAERTATTPELENPQDRPAGPPGTVPTRRSAEAAAPAAPQKTVPSPSRSPAPPAVAVK